MTKLVRQIYMQLWDLVNREKRLAYKRKYNNKESTKQKRRKNG